MKWHQRFFWFLLLFLPTQLGVHFWPDWAMVLGRRVDYLAPTIYLTDILLLLTLVTFIISNLPVRQAGFKFLISKHIRIILFGLLFVVVNIFVATNPMVTFLKWIKFMEFVLLGWYIVKTKPRFASITTPLLIGVFYSSVLAIVQFFLQHSVGGLLWWLGERTFSVDTPGIARTVWQGREILRPYATFPHPNVLGGFLAAVLPFLIYNLQIYKPTNLQINGRIKKMYQWFLGVTFVVGIVALLLTFSRSAIVIGILALIFVLFQKKKILFSLAIFFLALSIFPALPAGRLFPFSFFEESVVVRLQLNAAAISMWRHSPAFGVGLGNFLVELPKNLVSRQIYFLQPVHNIYLLLLSEIGAVGIAGIVGVVWVALRKKKRVLFVPLIAYLLLGFVDHYPLTLQQGQLLLTVLAARALLSVH